MNIEESPNSIERDYLLGGGGKGLPVEAGGVMSYEDHRPLVASWAARVITWSSGLTFLLAGGLVATAAYEIKDKGVNDPMLICAALIGSFQVLVALAGWAGADKSNSGNASLKFHHFGSMFSMFLMIALATGTLIRWDIGGKAVHDLFFGNSPATNVEYRYFLWGFALGVSLLNVVSIFGTLGREWHGDDMIFKRTLTVGCLMAVSFGAFIVAAGMAVWHHGEADSLGHPVYILGSILCAAAYIAVALYGITVTTVRSLTKFLLWLPVTALPLMIFSILNAAVAEPAATSERRTNMLLSGILGMWGQFVTVVCIVAGSRFRFFLRYQDLLPEYNRF